ncbi:IS3 family transposase, partial [Bacillus subtilis]|nr:IS3 family transposase [Bacillus subtilis]
LCSSSSFFHRTVFLSCHYYSQSLIQTKLNNQSPINYRQLAV